MIRKPGPRKKPTVSKRRPTTPEIIFGTKTTVGDFPRKQEYMRHQKNKIRIGKISPGEIRSARAVLEEEHVSRKRNHHKK